MKEFVGKILIMPKLTVGWAENTVQISRYQLLTFLNGMWPRVNE